MCEDVDDQKARYGPVQTRILRELEREQVKAAQAEKNIAYYTRLLERFTL